jgi:hypothetical protein
VAFDFWGNRFLESTHGKLTISLPPASCQILAVRPAGNHPQLVSTSRHITQGIVDVLEETWDAERKTLSGRSLVVAGDPYELRIVAPDPPGEVQGAKVSPADQQAGVQVSFAQEGPQVRVHLTSPVSRAIRWEVAFGK